MGQFHLILTVLLMVVTTNFGLIPFMEIIEVISNEATTNSFLSNKLTANKSSAPVIGSPYDLSCSVADHVDIESCYWIHKDGAPMKMKDGYLADPYGNQVQGISVNSSNPKSCHISLSYLSSEDLGSWTCVIQHSASNQYQTAKFEVVDNKRDLNVRLPTSILPVTYKINLLPFLIPDNFSIAGHVDLDVEVKEATSSISIHIYDIIIHEKDVTVQTEDGTMLEVIGHGYDEERQFYIIYLGEEVTAGNLKLNIFFTGNLNNELAGFYRSSYTDQTGETKWLATTQFEATDARRAFPCFDEPAMKAVFQINLGRLPSMSSISNMPIEEEGVLIPGTEYVWDVYQPSLKMSTYLVAFVVSDFVFQTSAPTENGVEFRIWSREEASSQTEWARQIGPEILAYYEEYFDTEFPLPKQDMIAIPDFSAGAMENWGLITYREVAILYEEGVSSRSDKEYVAVVVAHELAHQWFGDLVTMEWWTDLWLNEGFASYTEYIGTNVVSPETAILDRFVIESVQPALGYDSLESSHPISIPVNHPSEISEIFDTISYLKGGSVIRMMANFLGISTFNKGIANYLHANAFGNANQDTLWQFLTDAGQSDGTLVDVTVKQVMDTWTVQMGYPVVEISRQYGFPVPTASVKQTRFLLTGPSNNTEDENSYTWWVPLSYTSPNLGFENTGPAYWMDPSLGGTLEYVEVKDVSDDEPLIANVQQTGFYRVNYDIKNWEMISESLVDDHSSIHRMNRAQILNDAMELARGGLLDYNVALATTEYLEMEEDFIPWKAAIGGFTYLKSMIKRSAGYGDLKAYLLSALQPLYDRLGFFERPGETYLDEKLRISMLSFLCSLGHSECGQTSSALLDQWMGLPDPDSDNPIPPSIRSTVLCSAVSGGDVTHWDFLWQRYLASNNANEKNNILSSLSCTQEIWLLDRFLAMSINEESGVRKQDGYRVITGVSNNIVGRYVAWNWIRANWSQLSAYYDTAISSSVGRIISAAASDFNTEWDLRELEQFIEEHKDELGSAGRDATVMVESTKANIDWMKKHYQTIIDWLQPHLPENKEKTTNQILRKLSRPLASVVQTMDN